MPKPPTSSHFDPHACIARIRREVYGYIVDEADLKALGEHPDSRLWPVLIRCGGGRFTCPAQDAIHFIRIIQQSLVLRGNPAPHHEQDYIRDVSLLAGYEYGGGGPWPVPIGSQGSDR